MAEGFFFDNVDNEFREEEKGTYNSFVNFREIDNTILEVREFNKVKYFFDLSGTNPENTEKALNAFQQKIILITGGKDENMSYDSLGEIMVKKVKHLILIGQTSGLIEMGLMRKLVGKNQGIDIRITRCSTLKQAVDCAYLSSKPGDSVLFSPASGSISDEKNYHELKELYTEYIDAL
ncbi:MAG: hypothetical protein GX022_00915 [Clostridiaceae bacterium]|nr:hypothetical protein [Clostridiaceae bacterium]